MVSRQFSCRIPTPVGIRASPLSPIGRGSGLKIRAVWVRVPQRARGFGKARTLTSGSFRCLIARHRPPSPMVEAADLESAQSGFESRGGHACCTVSVRCSYVTGAWWCNYCHGMPAFRVSLCIPTGRGDRLKSGTVWVRIPPGALRAVHRYSATYAGVAGLVRVQTVLLRDTLRKVSCEA